MKQFVVALFLALCLTSQAFAAGVSGTGASGPNVTNPGGPRLLCTLTTTAATSCSNGAGFVVGAANNNTVAQTALVSCWGNDTTLTVGAGKLVFSTGALGVPGAAGAGFFLLPGPKPFGANLVCQASALPTGGGIDIYGYN